MNSASRRYVRARSCTTSVTGPQNRLTQKTGVEKTTRTGRPDAIALAMVVRCRLASRDLPVVRARVDGDRWNARFADHVVLRSRCILANTGNARLREHIEARRPLHDAHPFDPCRDLDDILPRFEESDAMNHVHASCA